MSNLLVNSNGCKYQCLKKEGDYRLLVQIDRKSYRDENLFVVCNKWNKETKSWQSATYYDCLDSALNDFNESVDEEMLEKYYAL